MGQILLTLDEDQWYSIANMVISFLGLIYYALCTKTGAQLVEPLCYKP
jgi:hypothetical protein